MTTRIVPVTDLEDRGEAHLFEGGAHGAPVSFFVVHAPPGTGPGLHRHPYVETFVVQEGQATFRVGAQTMVVHGGEIVVAPAGVPHSFVNSGDGVLRSVNIHPVAAMETEWIE